MRVKLTMILTVTLLLTSLLPANLHPQISEKESPKRILERHLAPSSLKGFEESGSYCEIHNDLDNPAFYWPEFDSGTGFAVHMDPSLCGVSPYPFQITNVLFYLYDNDPSGFLWPVDILVNVREVALDNKCMGPQSSDVLCSELFTIPSDSSYYNIARPMNLTLNSSCYVDQPFFLEIEYVDHSAEGDTLPSLLMDDIDPPPDTCDNWMLLYGEYHEWSDLWASTIPGDAIIRAGGHTSEECVYPEHFIFSDNTGDSYSIVIDSAFLNSAELEECDEIGVFCDTADGKGFLCVGASVYHPQDIPIPLVAWRDDPQTEQQDGYSIGDTIYFRVWSRNQDREEDALASYEEGDGHFESGIFSKLWLAAPFSGFVTVISPNGGWAWCIDSTYCINWSSWQITEVKIEYTTDGGSSWSTVANNVPADPGTYDWIVPPTPSQNCKVRVCDAGDSDPCDESDRAFTIWDGPHSFLYGDANGSGKVEFGDVIYLINYLFRFDVPPEPYEAGDADCGGDVKFGDVIFLVNYLFRFGPPPGC